MNRILVVSGVIIAVLWAFITWMSHGIPASICAGIDRWTGHLLSGEIMRMANGFHYDVYNGDMPTVIFLISFFVIFFITFFLTWVVEMEKSTKHTLAIIIFFSIAFRLIVLPGVLIHENDIYRYLWDGKTINSGINPFKYAPGDLMMYESGIKEDYYDERTDSLYRARSFTQDDVKNLDQLLSLRDQNPVYFDRISYKEVATIYPPVAQGVFSTSVAIRSDSIVLMKFVFVLFDIGILFLILALLKHFKQSPAYVLIYGWSPLVVREFANAGHYDTVAIFFTLFALVLFLKQKYVTSSGALALAVLSKFYAFVLLPIFRRGIKRQEIFFFVLIIVLSYVPYVMLDQAGLLQVFSGLKDYGKEWAYNAGIYSVVYAAMDAVNSQWTVSLLPSKAVVGIMYLGFLGWIFLRTSDDDRVILRQCFLAVAGVFLFSPVGDPWYYCWVMPFLCLFRYRSWILLSGLLTLSYINYRPDISFTEQWWLGIRSTVWVIYLPFFVYWIVEYFNMSKHVVSNRSL